MRTMNGNAEAKFLQQTEETKLHQESNSKKKEGEKDRRKLLADRKLLFFKCWY